MRFRVFSPFVYLFDNIRTVNLITRKNDMIPSLTGR